MDIKVTVTEREVLDTPNDSSLAELVREKYWNQRNKEKNFDTCVICGKESPYTRETHIDERIGYIEGAGQGCFRQPKCSENYY